MVRNASRDKPRITHTHTHMASTHLAPSSCSSFLPARVLRRTGRHSYAVQLHGCPGVVEIVCTQDKEDWGYMTDTWTAAHCLEDRLCKLGTRGMFAWDERAKRMAPSAAASIVEYCEGVQVQPGPYDVKRRAFVQSQLRVVGAAAAAADQMGSGSGEGEQHGGGQDEEEEGEQEEEKERGATGEKKSRRRLFRWGGLKL